MTNARIIIVLLLANTLAAFLPSNDANLPHNHKLHHESSVPTSFMHFHGPVEGPEFQVKVPYADENYARAQLAENHNNHLTASHGQDYDDYAMDYVAHPKYRFSYGVEDHHTGDFHSQKESRDGELRALLLPANYANLRSCFPLLAVKFAG